MMPAWFNVRYSVWDACESRSSLLEMPIHRSLELFLSCQFPALHLSTYFIPTPTFKQLAVSIVVIAFLQRGVLWIEFDITSLALVVWVDRYTPQ